ncbi:hypothetical protein [Geomonas oryzae]|uniref:hypothetical protein n=1 Tax=Geomonas oryzae TaxID=2364273 RepID=UPI00100A7C8C|nr:hypothetical protein [Geomonas oryzae]
MKAIKPKTKTSVTQRRKAARKNKGKNSFEGMNGMKGMNQRQKDFGGNPKSFVCFCFSLRLCGFALQKVLRLYPVHPLHPCSNRF